MVEPDRCCGFGGLFSLRMPEVSNAMTAEKRKQAAETQAEVLVTADPGCLMQIRGLPEPAAPPAEHLATLLERLTRPEEPDE
jgi:L-lactate dehydrogenase complex protein LldE